MDLDKKYHVLHLQYYICLNKTHENRKCIFESNVFSQMKYFQ